MPSNSIISKFELHYIFTDDSHAMDAIVRNKCEREFLAIVEEVSSLFDVDALIETEAFIEGGLKERFSLVAKNKHFQGFVVGVLTIVMSSYITTDKKLIQLQKENLKLSIEKLKQDLISSSVDKPLKTENPSFVINNYKIIKHRSVFYKNLITYNKVTKLSTDCLTANNESVGNQKIIERDEFCKFILESDEIETEIDEDANIEIISPVLKKGNYKWKGLYKGETIVFYMKDNLFKESVVQEGMQFKNGTVIDCVLEISRKLDDLGEIVISGYAVTVVISKHDDEVPVETQQGKTYKRKKKMEESQMNFFDSLESKKD